VPPWRLSGESRSGWMRQRASLAQGKANRGLGLGNAGAEGRRHGEAELAGAREGGGGFRRRDGSTRPFIGTTEGKAGLGVCASTEGELIKWVTYLQRGSGYMAICPRVWAPSTWAAMRTMIIGCFNSLIESSICFAEDYICTTLVYVIRICLPCTYMHICGTSHLHILNWLHKISSNKCPSPI